MKCQFNTNDRVPFIVTDYPHQDEYLDPLLSPNTFLLRFGEPIAQVAAKSRVRQHASPAKGTRFGCRHRELSSDTAPTRGPHRGFLLEKIVEYLNRHVGIDSRDPEGVRLLRAVAEYLDLEVREEAVHENLTTPILGTLMTIQERLDRIEKQGVAKSQQHSSYAAAAVAGKSGGNTGITKNIAPKTTVAQEAIQEARKAKEIIIRVMDARERNNMQKMTTRELVQSLQSVAPEVVGVAHLPSGDL